jgi:hypothetical protein
MIRVLFLEELCSLLRYILKSCCLSATVLMVVSVRDEVFAFVFQIEVMYGVVYCWVSVSRNRVVLYQLAL